jgi:hypothetical protein
MKVVTQPVQYLEGLIGLRSDSEQGPEVTLEYALVVTLPPCHTATHTALGTREGKMDTYGP